LKKLALKIFSFDHIMFMGEFEIRIRSSKEIMLGVSTAALSKELPTYLQILICDMATGFKVYCLSALEGFVKNDRFSQRDIKCVGLKLVMEPTQKNSWTCWPCLDFLKKFNTKLYINRKSMKVFQAYPVEQRRTTNPSYWYTSNRSAANDIKEPNS